MNASSIPNLISVVRLLLIVPTIWCLVKGYTEIALILFMFAGASDGVDGYLARRYQWQSRLGGFLDPMADKTMMISILIALAWLQEVPLWLVALVISRDIIIVLGSMAYYFFIGHYAASPILISKITTVAQIFYVTAILFAMAELINVEWLLNGLQYAVVVSTILSGCAYVVIWGRKALGQSESVNAHD